MNSLQYTRSRLVQKSWSIGMQTAQAVGAVVVVGLAMAIVLLCPVFFISRRPRPVQSGETEPFRDCRRACGLDHLKQLDGIHSVADKEAIIAGLAS